MGCFQSKKDGSDLHPNVFRVVNIDEHGADLCTGQLEITDSEINLYREGRDSTVWPLHSLRRYGFEGDIFSFESGRRCETGEGIYAFRCRRAPLLFHTLQQQIQLRNTVHDTVPYPTSRITPSPPTSRQTLQASVVHRSSVDNGQPAIMAVLNNNMPSRASAGLPHPHQSPSNSDILEVMPLYPRPQTSSGNHVSNVYEVREFKHENNNNQVNEIVNNRHAYTNDLSRDLAVLRNNLRQETALNIKRDIEDETIFLEKSKTVANNLEKSIVSPTLSSSSEHYAQLSIEQQTRLYVNIPPNDSAANDSNKSDAIPTTPLTPKLVEYCNVSIGTRTEPSVNTYANLLLGEISDNVKNVRSHASSDNNQKFSESDTFTSMSPVEEMEVNYAVLDIDNKDGLSKPCNSLASPELQSYSSSKNNSTASYSSQSRARLVSQASVETPTSQASGVLPNNIGYTTIDFDKTAALSTVAAAADLSTDMSRRNRINSCGVGSPSTSEKARGNN